MSYGSQNLGASDQRVIVLMSDRSEGEALCAVLRDARLGVELCEDSDELRRRFELELGVVVVDEACLRPPEVHRLLAVLSAQPPWSDLPLIVVTDNATAAQARFDAVRAIESLGNMAMIERPVRAGTLISLAQFALRARRRQYELRDRLLELGARETTLREHKSRLEKSIRALLESKWREAARAAELEAVMDAVPAAVWIAHDRECQRITGSRYSYELLRLPVGSNASKPAREAAGFTDLQLMRGGVELKPEELPLQQAAYTGNEVRDVELDVGFSDGTVRNLFGHASPLRDESGELTGAVAAFVDITEQKRVQQQIEALNETLEQRVSERTATAENRAARLRQAASQLAHAEQRERRRLAQMLHDHLQQLLVACRMKLGLARRKLEGDSPGTGRVAEALGEADQMLNESLDASRSLTVELSPPILYEGGLAAALEWLGRQKLKKYGLHVDVEASADDEPPDEDTSVLLFQIVRELLFNVVKHGQTDHARIAMRRRSDQDGSDTVLVQVSDDGVGFEASELQEGGFSDDGFGLLSIRERLSVVGGQLRIDSSPNQGARFEVAVPLGSQLEAAAPEPAEPSEDPGGTDEETATTDHCCEAEDDGQRIRLLVVDDNDTMREGITCALNDEPDMLVVAEAADGQEAVDQAVRHRPQVIIMDIAMPRLNGIKATELICLQLPQTRIIGLSMHEEEEMVQAMRSAGAADYVPKGSGMEPLIGAIRQQAAVS